MWCSSYRCSSGNLDCNSRNHSEMFLTDDKFLLAQNAKVVTRFFLSQEMFPSKSTLHTRKALANALLQNFSTNDRNPFTQRPKTTLESHFFFRKRFSSGKKLSSYVNCSNDYSAKKNKSRSPGCLRSITKQTNEHTLYSKKNLLEIGPLDTWKAFSTKLCQIFADKVLKW